MDYAGLTCELLLKMRGKHSQSKINRRLGFKHNKISKWELGTLAMRWGDFLRFAQALEIDLNEIFTATFGFRRDSKNTGAFLDLLFAARSSTTIAAALGRSADQIRRWRRRPNDIRVSVFLEFIDKLQPGQLTVFLNHLMKPKDVAKLIRSFAPEETERQAAYHDPAISLIPYVFSLDSYRNTKKHSDQFVADTLDLPIETVKKSIRTLEEQGVIVRSNGLYQSTRLSHLDLSADLAGFHRLLNYHILRASRRFESKKTETKTSGFFNVFTVTKEGLEEVHALNRQYYGQLVDIVQKYANGGTHVLTAFSIVMDNHRLDS